jgi:hypothetical protein
VAFEDDEAPLVPQRFLGERAARLVGAARLPRLQLARPRRPRLLGPTRYWPTWLSSAGMCSPVLLIVARQCHPCKVARPNAKDRPNVPYTTLQNWLVTHLKYGMAAFESARASS